MPGDKETIEQFAARIKAKYPDYKDVNDTDLVNRIITRHPEYKDSVDFGSGQPSPTKQPSNGSSQVATFPAIPDIYHLNGPTSQEKHNELLTGAHDRVLNELQNSDKAIGSLLTKQKMKEFNDKMDAYRRNDGKGELPMMDLTFTKQARDMQAAQLKPLAIEDPDFQIKVLKEQAEVHPEKNNQIKADIYTLQAHSRPEKTDKIKENAEKIAKGDLDYNITRNQLQKPEGFFGSLGTSYNQRIQARNDYDFFQEAPPEKAIEKLETEYKSYDPDEPQNTPHGIGGYLGRMVGSQPPQALLAGIGVGMIPGAQEAAPWAAALVASPEIHAIGYVNSLKGAYAELRQQGASPEEAYKRAQNRADFDANVDMAQGALMTAAGTRLGLQAGKINLTQGFVKTVANATKDALKATTKEALPQGVIAAGLQGAKNLYSGKPLGENMTEVGAQTMAMIAGIGLLLKTPKALAESPKLLNRVKTGLANNPEIVNEQLAGMVKSGDITPDQANQVHEQLQQHTEQEARIPDTITDEGVRDKLRTRFQKYDQLKSELETVHESMHPQRKEQIKALEEEIAGLEKEGIEKSKVAEKEKQPLPSEKAILLLDEGLDKPEGEKGHIGEEYEDFKDHPEQLMSFINDEVNKGNEADMRQEFGDGLVDLSKENNPHTTSYAGIKNIKPKENAPTEQSAGALDVGESPTNGGALGEGNTGPEIPPGESQPEAQGKNQNQESQVDSVYELPFEMGPEDRRTGIKNAVSYATRFEQKLPKVEVPKLGSDTEVLQQGKELVDSGTINPHQVVDRILSTNEGMHPDEAKAMQYYMHQLGAHEEVLRQQVADAPDELGKAYANGQLQQLSDEIDAATEANIKGGKAWSDVGNIRQIVVDPAFNASREKSLIKEAYGGKLPPGVQERLDKVIKERDAAIDAKIKAEERLKNAAATKTVQKIKEVVEKEQKSPTAKKLTKEDILKEREQLIEDLKKAWKEDRGQLGAVPLPTQTIAAIGKLAVNYFKEGYVNLEELAAKVYDDVKAHIPGATKKDIRDAISQYDPLRDVAEDTAKAKLATKEKGINTKLTTGNILDKKKTPSINFEKDTEWHQANQKVINAEYKLKEEKRKAFESKKNMYQKGLMWAGRGFRLSVLSGYNVLGKLAAAATIGGAVKRIPEQAIGAIYSQIFKGISKKAPIEGSPNISAELKFYKEFFNPKTFAKNSWGILKSGASPLTKKFGSGEYEHIPGLYLPTDLHQIIKDPLKRGTFEASFKNAMSWASKQGLDITDPLVIQSMETASYKRAQYEIFQEQNWLSKKFSEFKTNMEKKGNIGTTGKFLADFMIPVSTVPTNIARRLTTTSPLGLIRGSAQVIESYRKGIENLSNEQADAVMKQLKQGSLGTALWLIGWFGASKFGGLYSKYNPDKKRQEGELSSDEMSVDGKMIPKPVQHALPLEIIQLAATMRHIHDNYTDRKKSSEFEADYNAALGSIGALAEQIPVIETGAHLFGAFNNPYEAAKLKEDVKRRFQPQILRETGIIKKEEKPPKTSGSGKAGKRNHKR